MNVQLRCQIVHGGLEGSFVRYANVYIVIEILLRQQVLRCTRPYDAVDDSRCVVEVVALGNTHQGESRSEVMGLGEYPVAQGLGQGEGYGIPQLP